MNRLNLIANMLLISVTAAAQRTIVTERAVVRQELELNETPVEQIDSSLNGASHLGLPTSLAVKNYVDSTAFGGGGSADTITFAADSGAPISRSSGETLTIAGAGIATTSASGTTVTVTATEVDGSVTNEKDTVTTLIQDSILVYSLSGAEVGRDTIRTPAGGASLPSDNITGAGSYPRVALWTAAQTIGSNANFSYTSPVLTLVGTGNSLLLTPTTAGTNTAGKWYTSSANRPHFMDGTTDWPLVRGSAESFTAGGLLLGGTSGQATQDAADLYWDGDRLGVGLASPLDGIDLRTVSGGLRVSTTSNGTVSMYVNGSLGPHLVCHTDASNNSTINVGAVRWLASRFGHIFETSPQTAIAATRSWSTRLVVSGELGTPGDVGIGGTISSYSTLAGASMVVKAGKVGIADTSPQRTLHVAGEVRVTDLTTDTPTRIVGADADGDFGAITLGTGVSIDAGVLNVYAPLFGSGTPVVSPRYNGDRYFDHANAKWYFAWDNEDGDGTGDGLDPDDWIMIN